MTKREKALWKRRIFLSVVALILAGVIFLLGFLVKSIFFGGEDDTVSEITSSEITSSMVESEESSTVSSEIVSSVESIVNNVSSEDNVPTGAADLDPNFSILLLVNADNPLPDNYDSEVRANLVEIDPKYRNNNYVKEIHKDVYPYVVAMVSAAQAEGVDLRVWSPFRSYAIQKDLFQKQVNRVGGDEALAATVVARPGTSEHNTGICADFNMASDAFENTKMYAWMKENAEDYGFVMRYRKDKQPITGVIHESWHWRFVGINSAKEMNRLDMCLEEYVEYLENKNVGNNSNASITENTSDN